MVARERFDDEKAIKVEKIKLDGKKLTIAVERGIAGRSTSGRSRTPTRSTAPSP